MAVIEFRYHSFQYAIDTHEEQYDENGDFIPAKISYSEEIKCNAVPNGGEAIVRNAEGRKVEYSYTLYCDTDVKDFSYGEIIRLNRNGSISELSVKGFHRYMNMVKIWV